jgi:hypothetical protein
LVHRLREGGSTQGFRWSVCYAVAPPSNAAIDKPAAPAPLGLYWQRLNPLGADQIVVRQRGSAGTVKHSVQGNRHHDQGTPKHERTKEEGRTYPQRKARHQEGKVIREGLPRWRQGSCQLAARHPPKAPRRGPRPAEGREVPPVQRIPKHPDDVTGVVHHPPHRITPPSPRFLSGPWLTAPPALIGLAPIRRQEM